MLVTVLQHAGGSITSYRWQHVVKITTKD